MKVKASVKADPSKGDILVRRKGRLYVINKKDLPEGLKRDTEKYLKQFVLD